MDDMRVLRNFGAAAKAPTVPITVPITPTVQALHAVLATPSRTARRKQMEEEGAAWMSGRDHGLSSDAMVCAVLRIPHRKASSGAYPHPLDPDDLGRCLRLIKRFPWAALALPILAERSGYWRRLYAIWDDLTLTMEREVGINWSKGHKAEATYEMMRKAIEGK